MMKDKSDKERVVSNNRERDMGGECYKDGDV